MYRQGKFWKNEMTIIYKYLYLLFYSMEWPQSQCKLKTRPFHLNT